MKVKITLDDGEKKDIVDMLTNLESSEFCEKKYRRELRDILSTSLGQVPEKVLKAMNILNEDLYIEVCKERYKREIE